ncbi:MAG: hypothetical protein LZF60_10022 [Nitrospira sp.]|nr:MAG: hypothetical protein LZF60_10022 [Nitrospira sp.]
MTHLVGSGERRRVQTHGMTTGDRLKTQLLSLVVGKVREITVSELGPRTGEKV